MAGIGSQTPNWREALAAVDSISHNATYVTSTNGKLDVNASATISGSAIPISGATTAIVTAIVDSSGNQISTFGGGTQYTDAGTPPAHPVGTMPIFNNAGTWSQVSNSAGLPVNIVGGSSSGTQYIQGGATVANPTGTAEIWFDGSGNPKAVTSSQPQPSNLTDGTNTANILKSDGTFAGQNALLSANQMPNSSTATWTTATSLNTALAISTVGLGTVMVSTVETGTTTTAGALTFEAYDGTNWWVINGQQVGTFTIQSSYTLANNTNVAWTFDVAGFQQFRVRLSTAITGTGTPQVVVIAQAQAAPNDITPSVGWAQQLDQTNDALSAWEKGSTYTKITASTQISASSCVYYGYTCESIGTAGTLTVYDNTAASGNSVSGGTITLAVGMFLLPVPIILTTGCYGAIGGTTPTVNILTRALSK